MTTFNGQGYTIYSGLWGSVIVRPDGIWVESSVEDTIFWEDSLLTAMDYVRFER